MNLEAINRYHLAGAGLIGLAVATVVFKSVIITVTAVALATFGALTLWYASLQQRPVAMPPAQQPRILRRPPALNLQAISRVSPTPESPSVYLTPRSAPGSPEEFSTPHSVYVTPRSPASPSTPPGEVLDVYTPRESVEPERISIRQCVLRLARLAEQYGNISQWNAVQQQEAQGLIASLENHNRFDISRELRRLQKEPTTRRLLDLLLISDVLPLFPQEPGNLKEFILLVCTSGPITMDVFNDYADCLERFCKEGGLALLDLRKETQSLYATDREIQQALDGLLARRDWVELLQRRIDWIVSVTGVTQERACELLARKDYVGLVEHFFNARPLIQSERNADRERQLDKPLAKIIEVAATTWSAQFLLPPTWKTLTDHFKQINRLRPQPQELVERLQILYQTNPAIKKHVDGLLHPGYLNPDSLTKKNVILAIVRLGMYLGSSQLKVSQEDVFGLLGQKNYADLARRVLVSA